MPKPYREETPRIREWRLVRGLKQEELALRMEVHQPMISNIERGIHYPTFETLNLAANVLRITVDQLFEDPFQIVRARVDQK